MPSSSCCSRWQWSIDRGHRLHGGAHRAVDRHQLPALPEGDRAGGEVGRVVAGDRVERARQVGRGVGGVRRDGQEVVRAAAAADPAGRDHRLEGDRRVEVEDELGAGARHQPDGRHLGGLGEIALVGGDLGEGAAVAALEGQDVGGGGVQDAEAGALPGGREAEGGRVDIGAVAQHRVAEAVGEIAGDVVLDVAAGVDGQALQDERDVVDAVLARQRRRGVRVVLDDDHPGQSVDDLLGRGAQGVRVVPEGLGLVLDLEGGRPGLTVGEGVLRAAVHLGRDVGAVEVDTGVRAQAVGDVQQDRAAGGPLHGRAEE